MDAQKQLRQHLLELLEGKFAHIDLESAIKDFPVEKINTRIGNSPHSAWELLEHIRIAQWDILDFSTNANYKEMKWPDNYWPKKDGTKKDWNTSVKQILKDLKALRSLVKNAKNDLYAQFPWGNGQTLLREVILLADHNAYHLGQIVLLNKMHE